MSGNVIKYKGYSAEIQYSEADGLLVGRVLGIRDIIDFHGESVADVCREFEQAIDEYLKACEKLGEKPEKPMPDTLLMHLSTGKKKELPFIPHTPNAETRSAIEDARAGRTGEISLIDLRNQILGPES